MASRGTQDSVELRAREHRDSRATPDFVDCQDTRDSVGCLDIADSVVNRAIQDSVEGGVEQLHR